MKSCTGSCDEGRKACPHPEECELDLLELLCSKPMRPVLWLLAAPFIFVGALKLAGWLGRVFA